jgi:hypothetical protein
LRTDKIRLETVRFKSILLQFHVQRFVSTLSAVLELAAVGQRLAQRLLRVKKFTFSVFSNKA